MKKSEVYSWRIEPELKRALEQAAQRERTNMAQLLHRIVRDWLHKERPSDADEERQRCLHAAAQQHFGTLHSGGPDLAETAKQRVRSKI